MNTATDIRKPWQKPTLAVHHVGAQNNLGAAHNDSVISAIDGLAVEDLLREFGSPLFVISERRLRENMRRLRRAFITRYPRVRFGWSYKTNYLNSVCNILHQEGSWAEVVSGFEYQKARALGVPGKAIIFNGPHKTREALEAAVREQAWIHIDNFDELYLLEDIARRFGGKRIPVGIRLNFETGFTEPWSRFGFNLEAGQAIDAVRRIAASPYLELRGLHSHIGTFILDPRAYAAQVRIMCNFMNEIEASTGCEIRYLDIGGGFASQNWLHGVYLPPEQAVPTFESYAETICDALLQATAEREAAGRQRPLLVLETGRAVVDDAEMLVSRVVAGKQLPDGRRAAVMDAGLNLLFTSLWYHHQVRPTRQLPGAPENTVLYGPLCMNIDVLRHSALLPPLDVGEPLVFSPAGAYNNTQWMQFIELRPNIVMIDAERRAHVVRRADTLEFINSSEYLPESLSDPFPNGVPE
ncbi:MAG: alanine racemase [Burkholderiales bacterium]